MCVVKTADDIFGITNRHVLNTYEKHKAKKVDIFCQLGSAAFDPTPNLIDVSEYWDLATFRIPDETLQHFGHKVFVAREWPPRLIETTDHVVYGGYPEDRRTVLVPRLATRVQPRECVVPDSQREIDLA